MPLALTLSGAPPLVRISRAGDVPNELWLQLARNISPARSTTGPGVISVPIEDLLAARNWLGSALERYGCDAELDASVRALLTREEEEQREIALLLNGEIPNEDDLVPAERVGRFDLRRLRPFQRRDLNRMLSLSNSANFSVPGAGKTAVAYACYEFERVRTRVQRLLVVAPLSAFDAWTEEPTFWMHPVPVVAWLNGRIPYDCEVLLVNYQRLVSKYAAISAWVKDRPCHVILDEAHRIKRGRPGEWGGACLDLAYLAARRDILTGTPAPQHPSDFVALIDFLWPRQTAHIVPRTTSSVAPSPSEMARISRNLRPLFVRTNKRELELPEPQLQVEYVDMKPLQSLIYGTVRGRMQQQIRATPLEKLQLSQLNDVTMYLIEAATNPALLGIALGTASVSGTAWPPTPVPDDSPLVQTIREYARHEIPAKYEKLATIVSSNAERGRKTLVWSNFVANLEDLARRVLAPYGTAIVHGKISARRQADNSPREQEIRRFRHDSDCMVLLANPAAMSEGISLHQVCHDAVYLDRTFNAGQYLQSLDRIHRLGLADDVDTRITFLVSRGTIDETIDRRVRLKAERLATLLEDEHLLVMSLPDLGEDYGEWIEPDDLESLFGHLAD